MFFAPYLGKNSLFMKTSGSLTVLNPLHSFILAENIMHKTMATQWWQSYEQRGNLYNSKLALIEMVVD